MATWDPPTDTEIDVDKPLKAVDIRRIRDLSQAMAEGSAGSPDISTQWVYVEDTYNFSVDGAVATFECAAFEDGYEYGFEIENIGFGNGNFTLEL